MTLPHRILATACIALGIALAGAASAQPRLGDDYEVLKVPQPVTTGDKIEVIEFFWYGCIHCYNLEPQIESWLKKKPAHVEFRRVPAIFNERWSRDAAIFYALQAIGALDRLHRPLFDAIHRDRLDTAKADAFNQWLSRNGVDQKKFDDALRSFGVQSQVRRAAQMSVSYRIEGTPAIAVQGKYIVGNSARAMDTTDYLIELARRERGAKK